MNKQIKFAILLVFLALTFIVSFYGKVITSPNSFLFSSNGDAMKNYYTYAFYIKNNVSNIEFEGMNYPYNENFMYTDCHPLQASSLKFINQYFPQVSDYSVGLLNIIMLLSIALTSFILYLIFIKLEINRLLSVLGALAITILSPQLFRLTGHLALSYSFFIPLTIYLLLLFEKNPRKIYTLFLFLVILLFFFTHAYLGMIASVMVFVYSSIGVLNNQLAKREKTEFLKYLQTLLASIIPVFVFCIFVKLTDSHTGRTTNPWGIFENHAEISTIFLPISGPLNIIKDALFDDLKQTWEGWAYTGIVAIAVFSFYIFSFTRKKSLYAKWSKNHFLNRLFITSVLILCLSTLLPFRKLMFTLVDNFDMIKQFRAIGRFAWVFYFITNILAIFIIDKVILHFKERKRMVLANVLIVLVPAIIAVEGISYHYNMSHEVTKSQNLFSLKQTHEVFQEDCRDIAKNKYQAIISLPFFYIGSENYGKSAGNDISKLSFMFSYHLDLPMINSYLTRTSIPESKKIMQLLASEFYKKDIEDDLKSDKPFLVICSNEELSKGDKNLLYKSKILKKREGYSLYEIDKNSLFRNSIMAEFIKFNSKKDLLSEKDGFLVSDTNLYFSYIDFDQYHKPPFEKDNSCFKGLQRNYNTIFSIKGSELDDTKKYIANFWIYNDGENYGQDCLNGMIFFIKSKAGKEDWIFPIFNARESHEINGNWSLAEATLSDIEKDADYKLVVKGSDRSKLNYYIDHLLFYDSKLDIYRLISSTDNIYLFYNNNRLEIPVNNNTYTK